MKNIMMRLNLLKLFIAMLIVFLLPEISKATLPTETIEFNPPDCGGQLGNCGPTKFNCYRPMEKCPIYVDFTTFKNNEPMEITLDNSKYESCNLTTREEDAYGFASITKTTKMSAEDMASGKYTLLGVPGKYAQSLIDKSKNNSDVTEDCPQIPLEESEVNKIDQEMKRWKTMCAIKKVSLRCTLKNPKPQQSVVENPSIPPSDYPAWLQDKLNKLINLANNSYGAQYWANSCAYYVSQLLAQAKLGGISGPISGSNSLYAALHNAGWTNTSLNNAPPGSVVFYYDNKSPPIYHTGIYVGNGMVSHVSSVGGYTINTTYITNIDSNYYIVSPPKTF